MTPKKFGRYEVLGLLGEGSMGRVYRAYDPLGQRPVAIKTVRPELLTPETSQEYLRRFRREAQAAGALSHQSIITIFDVGEDYFVMEMLDGATLQGVLRERGRLLLAEALAILGPVAEALDYAHARGVIHRDVKPGNLMILPDGRTKIMDFGVAHLSATAMSVSGQFLGSPSYMAPERIQRGEATPSSDLFSLAVVAYESLTGKKPFPGETVSEVVSRVVKDDPLPPSAWNRELPPGHDAVFRRGLAKSPAARYPNAAAFLAALADPAGKPDGRSAPLAAPVFAAAPVPTALPEPSETSVESGTLVDVPEQLRRAPPGPGMRLGTAGAVLLLASIGAGYWLKRPPPVPVPAVPSLEPTAAAARAAQPPGLTIETKPSGARVSIDGVEVGFSPLTLADLSPGRHTVRATREGLAAELGVELGPDTGLLPLTLPLYPVDVGATSTTAPVAEVPQSPWPGMTGVSAAEAPPADTTAPATDEPPRGQPPEGNRATPDPVAALSLPVLAAGEPVSYPADALRLRMRGTVAVEVEVLEDGRVGDVQILAAPHQFLSDAVVEAVKTWRFTPALKDGKPVRYRLAKSFDFDPDKVR